MGMLDNPVPRDPARIVPLSHRLTALWATYPDLRLGQLILNFVNEDALYNIEDDELLRRLEEGYSKLSADALDQVTEAKNSGTRTRTSSDKN